MCDVEKCASVCTTLLGSVVCEYFHISTHDFFFCAAHLDISVSFHDLSLSLLPSLHILFGAAPRRFIRNYVVTFWILISRQSPDEVNENAAHTRDYVGY